MDFTIDRKTWRSGNNSPTHTGEGETMLLNEEGYMCCLGQCLRQIDPNAELLNKYAPSSLSNIKSPFVNNQAKNTALSTKAIMINDNGTTTIPKREADLIALFKSHGHTLVFID